MSKHTSKNEKAHFQKSLEISALVVLIVILIPFLRQLTEGTTATLLATFHLAQYNPGNWVGTLVGLLAICLWCGGGIKVIAVYTAQRHRWEPTVAALRARAGSIVLAIPAAIITFVISILMLRSTFQLVFLFSILIGAVVAQVANASMYIPWDGVIRGFRLRWILCSMRVLGEIPWGGLSIKQENEPLHFAIMGNTGAGKSTWLEVIMTVVLIPIGRIPNRRGIIFDAKRDLIPLLESLEVPYKILNPLDERTVAWAIAKDIRGEGMASEFAAILLEELEGGENRYFYDAAKLAIAAGMVCLQKSKGETWTFRDLINTFETKADFQALLHRYHPRPQHFDEFLKEKKQDRNEVLTTVKSMLEQYSIVAARWENATDTFSWKDWERGEYLVVFGSDHLYRDMLKKTNTLLFRFGAACLNNLSANSKRRVWIFIDEATATGKLIQLETVLALGRSAGVCVVIAFQNVAGFIQEYGEQLFKTIFGLCRHKALLPMDPDSAKDVSDSIGEYEYVEESFSESVATNATSGTTVTFGTTTKLGKRQTLLPQQLMDSFLPQPGPANGLQGYFMVPGEGIHHCHYTWDEVQSMRAERLNHIPAYRRVDDASPSLALTPWSSEERCQLGLPPRGGEQHSAAPNRRPPANQKIRARPKPQKQA